MGTHLNCINKLMGTQSIFLYEVDKKYTGCNLLPMELLDCALMCGNYVECGKFIFTPKHISSSC